MTTVRLSTSTRRAKGRARWSVRTLRRVTRDSHALLAVGLVLTALTIALVGDHDGVDRVVAVSIEFLAAQTIAAIVAPYLHPTISQRTMIGIARFALAILYVSVVTGLLRSGDFRPAGALFIPVVALAAAQGSRQAILVGVAAISLYLLPVLSATPETLSIDAQRAVAFGGTAILLSIGTRHSISALTVTVRRLGAALARDRRRARQVAAVEGVGRLLATTGPDSAALERVVGLLRQDLGYDFVSVYLGNASTMRLAAQRGYDTVIDEFDGTTGVLGSGDADRRSSRSCRTSRPIPTTGAHRASSARRSAPRSSSTNEIVGIVNVEARAMAHLDQDDVDTMSLVADRLASALALADERERLAARAELFHRLTSFAAAVNGTLDPERLNQAIVDEVRERAGRRLGRPDGPGSGDHPVHDPGPGPGRAGLRRACRSNPAMGSPAARSAIARSSWTTGSIPTGARCCAPAAGSRNRWRVPRSR